MVFFFNSLIITKVLCIYIGNKMWLDNYTNVKKRLSWYTLNKQFLMFLKSNIFMEFNISSKVKVNVNNFRFFIQFEVDKLILSLSFKQIILQGFIFITTFSKVKFSDNILRFSVIFYILILHWNYMVKHFFSVLMENATDG